MTGDVVASNPSSLDLNDIQGMAMRAYEFPFGRHIVLCAPDPAGARLWLARVAGQLTSVAALDSPRDHAVNVALSWQGLKAIGLAADSLASFPEAFRQGMLARAGRLGDVADSAPNHWDAPLGSADVHILLVISAMSEAARAAAEQVVLAGLDQPGSPVVIFKQDVGLVPNQDGTFSAIEHFGFRDGIAQPAIEGSGIPAVPGQGVFEAGNWRPLKTGEFVLGYADEIGSIADAPAPDSLRLNGSYLVLRKLHQNVARFRAFVQQSADTDDGRRLVAAKMMGRWPSGAPLALAAESDDASLAKDDAKINDFNYADDLKGMSCPVGAHVRRMNPRAGLTGFAGSTVNRHRLLRQGLPYGTRLPPGGDDGADRGVVLILVNADIERQFEFVQSIWMNDGGFANLDSEKDPMLGNNDGTGFFTIPRRTPPRKRLAGIPAFVSTRGGEYFFLPGLRALAGILSAPANPA